MKGQRKRGRGWGDHKGQDDDDDGEEEMLTTTIFHVRHQLLPENMIRDAKSRSRTFICRI